MDCLSTMASSGLQSRSIRLAACGGRRMCTTQLPLRSSHPGRAGPPQHAPSGARAQGAGDGDLAALGTRLVTEMAAAEDPKTRRECAARVMDTWAREREQWKATALAERWRWRSRATTMDLESERADLMWQLVRVAVGEKGEKTSRAQELRKGMAAPAATLGDLEARLEWAAREMLALEVEVSDADPSDDNIDMIRSKLRRVMWELADFKVRRWDAEDRREHPIRLGGMASDKEEEEEVDDDDDLDAACRKCTGLPSSAHRRAMLKELMKYPKNGWKLLHKYLACP